MTKIGSNLSVALAAAVSAYEDVTGKLASPVSQKAVGAACAAFETARSVNIVSANPAAWMWMYSINGKPLGPFFGPSAPPDIEEWDEGRKIPLYATTTI